MENPGKQRWKLAKLAYFAGFALLACVCLLRSAYTAALRRRYAIADASAYIEGALVWLCTAACIVLALWGLASLFVRVRSVPLRRLALGAALAAGSGAFWVTAVTLVQSVRYYENYILVPPFYGGL